MSEREVINQVIAEQIMGCKKTGHTIWRGPTSSMMGSNVAWDVPGMGLMAEDELPDFHLPQFAFAVLDKLKMYEPELSWSDEGHTWFVKFHKHPAIGADPEIGPAICKAALNMVSLRKAAESAG
jgi:hypothetical protein